MEDKELKAIPVLGWEHIEGLPEMSTSLVIVLEFWKHVSFQIIKEEALNELTS